MLWELYEDKLNAYGKTQKDRQLEQAKEDFLRDAINNPSHFKVKRNGVEEDFLITRSDKTERFKITAFPGNDLNIGDYIEVWGETFLVYETRVQDTLNRTGVIWLCNHLFRWQNFTSDIIERWGILDSGVYSTTIRGETDVRYTNKQFKLLLPLDEDTKKLYIDKRLATDVMYNKNGKEILNVYQITGYDGTSENFGEGSHILYLNLRSDEFNDDIDNLSEKICNYISPTDGSTTEKLNCSIDGSATIRLGTKRKYSAVFYDTDGNIVEDIIPVWTTSELPEGITLSEKDSKAVFTVVDNVSLLGTIVKLKLTDGEGKYEPAETEIEIIGL